MKQLICSISNISQATLNLVFPVYCKSCGIKLPYDNKKYLCLDCIKSIRLNQPPFCTRCGKSVVGESRIKAICPDCLGKEYYFEAAWQCCKYDGIIKEFIHGLKYNKRLFLKDILIDILYNFIREHVDYKNIDMIIPVPMHRLSIHSRGFNQAAVISRGICQKLAIPLKEDWLIKIRKTKQQVGLKKDERLKNMAGSFILKKDAGLKEKKVLLIDDVFTTGATADECSKALISGGARSVWVVALARGI